MLDDKDAVATVAVKHLETAKKLYGGTLGFTKVMENEEVAAWFKDPDGNIFSLVTPPNTNTREVASASARSTT